LTVETTFVPDKTFAIQMQNINKTFPGPVHANKGINLAVKKGEIHALLGENGAGKTTLMNVLYGLYGPDDESSRIFVNGCEVEINEPMNAMKAMQNYYWPGNVRELRNVIERAVILSAGPNLAVELPKNVDAKSTAGRTLKDIEKRHILKILEMTGWRIRGRHIGDLCIGSPIPRHLLWQRHRADRSMRQRGHLLRTPRSAPIG